MKSSNSDYIAFLPIGLTFIILGITLENMTPFLAIGIVFLLVYASSGFSGKKKDRQENLNVQNSDHTEPIDKRES